MIKVRYTPADHLRYINLTADKIYDVVGYDDGDIMIIDDWYMKDSFDMYSSKRILEFVDVTAEHRCEVIDGILR